MLHESESDSDGDRKPPALPALPPMDGASANEDSDPSSADGGGDGEDEGGLPASASPAGFQISPVRKKNSHGALICMAVGCEKNAQAKTKIEEAGGGFCRVHYNAWLIGSGKVESWDCDCGNKVSIESDRCGLCHRWAKSSAKKRKVMMAFAAQSKSQGGKKKGKPLTYVPRDSGVTISNARETNAKGRTVCKVVGCSKLDQAKNDGFCRFHFNMFSINPDAGHGKNGDDTLVSTWSCVCGEVVSGKQKRCGKCQKWRGGKRDPYTTNSKKKAKVSKSSPKKLSPSITAMAAATATAAVGHAESGHWTCQCGNNVAATKSRCGKCHHWRGGKRKGGWKLKTKGMEDFVDDGIDRTQDWECCDVIIPARKKRCGKCHHWRGGKRVPAMKKSPAKKASNNGGVKQEARNGDGREQEYTITEFI